MAIFFQIFLRWKLDCRLRIMPDPKGSHLFVNLGASQTRRRLMGFGHGRKVQAAGLVGTTSASSPFRGRNEGKGFSSRYSSVLLPAKRLQFAARPSPLLYGAHLFQRAKVRQRSPNDSANTTRRPKPTTSLLGVRIAKPWRIRHDPARRDLISSFFLRA